jgi:hypothetical protein
LARAATWGAYLAVVIGIGIAGGWSAHLVSDEFRFYLPAIRQFEGALPSILWADYNFPGPPAALALQAIVYKLSGGSLLALRLFSTAMAVVAFFASERVFAADAPGRRPGLTLLMTGCFAYFLSATFLIRQHSVTIAGLAIGYQLSTQPAPSRSPYRALGASVALLLATLSNQMCVPFCALLAIRAFFSRGDSGATATRSRWLPMLVPAIPVVALTALILFWHGLEPPAFRANNASDAGVGLFHPAQLLVGLLSLGVWVFPALKQPRRSWLAAAALWLPCAFLVRQSDIYAPGQDFQHAISGPISSLIRHFSGAHPGIAPLLAGAPVACGVAFLMERGDPTFWLVRVYAALYIAMMSVTPFLFERYFLLLVLPLYWLLGRRLIADRSFWPVAMAQAVIALSGIAYTWSKLSEFTF